MKRSSSFFIVVLVLVSLTGCKSMQPVTTTETKDSTVTVIEKETIFIPVENPADSLNLVAYIECDQNNQAQMKAIDSLSRRLNVKVKVVNGKLSVSCQKKAEIYYYKYIYEKTLKEIYKKQIKTEVIVKEKRPINGFLWVWFIVSVLLLGAFVTLLIISKQ